MGPTWLTAFLDLPADRFDEGLAYWQAVTGYEVSEPRGDHGEFVTLVPPAGDAYLRVQRVQDGPGGVHLDVHAPGQDFEVRRSPGGLSYCLVGDGETKRPEPAEWGDVSSLVDQVCVDIPRDRFDEEVGFWEGLTGWELVPSGRPEFRRLHKPSGQAVNLLLQRIDEDGGPVRAHLDLSSTQRDVEAERHVALGGTAVSRMAGWTVMRDPVGTTYCITTREPWAEDGRR